MDRITGEAIIFDVCSFYGHNEYDTGNWRAPRHKLSQEAYIRSYKEHFPPSEPVEDWDARNLLYSLPYNIGNAIYVPGSTQRQVVYEDMITLYSDGLQDAIASRPNLQSSPSFMSGLFSINRTRQPRDDPEPLGLHTVVDPGDPVANIIFVHGLGGSAFKTWSWERKAENFWPKWLAQDEHLKRCRILTFGYHSDFKSDTRGLDVVDFAKDLLLQMLNYFDALSKTEAIIFVVHSMGGLVVKKAYTLGKHDKRFSDMISSISSIVFLATPHRGSQYAKMLNRVLSASPISPLLKAYVAALEQESPVIQDINKAFSQQCENLELVSFYETMPVKFGVKSVMIVEKESAVLGYSNEWSAPMKGNHNTICKYESARDPKFVTLRDTLKRLIPRDSGISDSGELKTILDILGLDQKDWEIDMPEGLGQSGTWLTSEPGFSEWFQATGSAADPQLYMLFGFPGSGKTVLSTMVIHKLQQGNQAVTVQHHFFSESHQAKRTVAHGLRSIAAQLATVNAPFRDALLRLHKETGLTFTDQNQSFTTIWQRVFQGLVFHIEFPQPLVWVLDGIDEIDSPNDLLISLTQLQSKTPIKVFLTSRPLRGILRFESDQWRSYSISEDDSAQDICIYATQALRHILPDDERLISSVVSRIMNNCSGSFLWVKLALAALGQSWHTEDDIQAALNELPSGMVPMYKRMLRGIESQPERSRKMARRILSCAACSWRPLRLQELQVILQPEFANLLGIEDTILQICGHFVKITPVNNTLQKQVSLVHKTVLDFLSKSDLQGGSAPFLDLQESHCHLALVCLQYLSSNQWRGHFDSIRVAARSQLRPVGDVVSKGHPLLEYAAFCWAYHVSNSPSEAPELSSALKVFFSKYFLSWVEAISLSGNLGYFTATAQYLKLYVLRQQRLNSVPKQDVSWLHKWATDIGQMVGKFGSSLLCEPSSVYRQLPAFAPENSMIGKTYRSSSPGSIVVIGLKLDTWGDCIAAVSVGVDEYATQVLATESYFITSAGTAGTIIVWDTKTCEKLRTIRVGSYVPLMAVNKHGTAVVSVTTSNYIVWELHTGRKLHTRAKSTDAMVLDMRFGSADYELILCFNNNSINWLDLRDGRNIEHSIILPLEASGSGLDYYGSPWRMALSPDLTKIAGIWRGRPPLIWDITPAGILHTPRKCHVKSISDSICGPEILRWHPDSDVLFIMCRNTSVVEWPIYGDEQHEWPDINAREITVSSDGSSLISMDYKGTICIWNIPGRRLVYSLIRDSELSQDLAFSPDGQRFYDISGSMCNVWEFEALFRANEPEDITDLPEPVISRVDSPSEFVTALSLGSKEQYYCRANEDGLVAIHDATAGNLVRKVYRHSGCTTIVELLWSESGKYIVSADDGGYVIAKRLAPKQEEGIWAVFPVFQHRLGDPIKQLLFSADERFLLISTPLVDYVWDLKGKKEVANLNREWPRHRVGRWTQHPFEKDLLVWMEPTEMRLCRWPDMGALKTTTDTEMNHREETERRVISSWTTSYPELPIIYATVPYEGALVLSPLPYVDLRIEFIDAETLSSNNTPPETDLLLAPSKRRWQCPLSVAKQVKHLLGTYKTSLVFLHHDCSVCTWSIGNEETTTQEEITRHFFVPGDWLNASMSHMAVVDAHGTFFCPRYGDVAIVRNGIRI
ncbi:hypothetical protein QBC43DRAFT_354843 [Cladorrhinum sp. PSN259]|nr:hypothetical protein QBC43DRAFT_354843 [Cladorrhinum sp. PSN259]